MYKNRAEDGRNNLCGAKVKAYRQKLPGQTSQKMLADMLQVEGLDIDKNAIQRIESGQRFVTDIELKTLAKVLHASYQDLLE
ncbi:MAG: helix-turn-helix transcriptional regulator [Lachnospiraceae bacterium]|nr:helix-turn-helix transcriptional regulator [Lachnospiraceae bacterium]